MLQFCVEKSIAYIRNKCNLSIHGGFFITQEGYNLYQTFISTLDRYLKYLRVRVLARCQVSILDNTSITLTMSYRDSNPNRHFTHRLSCTSQPLKQEKLFLFFSNNLSSVTQQFKFGYKMSFCRVQISTHTYSTHMQNVSQSQY